MADDHENPLIQEREIWPATAGGSISMAGISPLKFFAGLNDSEIHNLFYNSVHLNKNGQEYFTPLITPSLLQIYGGED